MPDYKLLQIKFKPDIWDRLQRAAQLDNRTITGFVRNLVNKALSENREGTNAND